MENQVKLKSRSLLALSRLYSSLSSSSILSKSQIAALCLTIVYSALVPNTALAYERYHCQHIWSKDSELPLLEFIDRLAELKKSPPTIDKDQFTESKLLKVPGINHEAFYRAKYQGHDVAIKWTKPDGATDSFYQDTLYWEFSMLKMLEEMKLGPKVYGFIKSNNRLQGIVMDFVEGDFKTLLQDGRHLGQPARFELDQILNSFSSINLVPMDMQFMLTAKNHIVLIDPALYFWSAPNAPEFPLKTARKKNGL